MHCTKILLEFEFEGHRPHCESPHPKAWHFAELLRKCKQTDVGVADTHCK